MDFFSSVILGIVQGLTEFLPVSSSGHLVIGQLLFGNPDPSLFFNVSLHMGTLVAVCIVFRTDIIQVMTDLPKLLTPAMASPGHRKEILSRPGNRLSLLVVIASIPTAVIGLLLSKQKALMGSPDVVGSLMCITAAILFVSKWGKSNRYDLSTYPIMLVLFIGIIQGLAVLPGISRSGSTIAVALLSGLNRNDAAKLSFLMSIPAIVGAELLETVKALGTGVIIPVWPTVAGTAASLIVGWLALNWLIQLVAKGKLHYFTPYCLGVGVATLIWL